MKERPEFVMGVLVAVVIAGSCVRTSGAQTTRGSEPVYDAKTRAIDMSPLPAVPSGRSTILGGAITEIDPVLDQFTLHIFGQKAMRILFDERTQLFLDGKKMELSDLHPSKYASVQTTLDGSSIFAISIHLLSQAMSGGYQGQVLSYNPTTRELTVENTADRNPLTLTVSSNTIFTRKGQDAFSSVESGPADLQRGSLISLAFSSDSRHHAVANQITVLATPGANFVFGGNLRAVDMASGQMALVDPRDEHSYQIHFSPSNLPIARDMRVGQRVRVAVEYDGEHYQARDITIY